MISLQDAKQRWERSILRASGEVISIAEIQVITRDGTVIFDGVIPTERGWDAVVRKVPVKEIDETCPDLGNVPLNDTCYYVSRKASHQFRRGYIASQIVVESIVRPPRSIPRDVIHKMSLLPPEAVAPLLVQSVFNKTYPPMMEAVRSINANEKLSVPFHRDLSVGASHSRWPILYYKTHAIGKVRGDVIVLSKEAAPFYEMVQEQSPLPVQVGV